MKKVGESHALGRYLRPPCRASFWHGLDQWDAVGHARDVAELVVVDGKGTLNLGIFWLGRSELQADCEVCLVGSQRLLALAGRGQQFTDIVVAEGEVALPLGVIGIGPGQILRDQKRALLGG